MANVAEPIVFTFPYRATPTTLKVRVGPPTAMRMRSPTAKWYFDAEPASRTTSPGPPAQRPLVESQRVEARLRRIDAETERRAAVAGDHLAVLVDQLRDVGVRVEVEDLAGGRLHARRRRTRASNCGETVARPAFE